nr:glycosyltransferase [Candidatus Poribacteria bacterium]
RDDVMDIIKKCNLVILPSYREGFPKVILEAGLCARAVIATDVPGCRELVVHEKSGLIVQKGDIRGLALAIQGLLKDEAKRKTLAGALHRHVQSHYTDDIVNPFWWELYTRKT